MFTVDVDFRGLAAAHTATAATIPVELLSNFERYYKDTTTACQHRARSLLRPSRHSTRLYFRVSPVFVCDFEDCSQHHDSIIIGKEGDRFYPNRFPSPCDGAADQYFVVVFVFLRRDGVLTDALSAHRFDGPIRVLGDNDDCRMFGSGDDAQFVGRNVVPQRERAFSSLHRWKMGLSIARTTEACMVCQRADRNVKVCSGCNMTCYCGVACQRQDRKRHMEACRCVQSILR